MGQCTSSSAAAQQATRKHKKPNPASSSSSATKKHNKSAKTDKPVVQPKERSPNHDTTVSTTLNDTDHEKATKEELDQLQNDIQQLQAKAEQYTSRRIRKYDHATEEFQSSWCMMTHSEYSASASSLYSAGPSDNSWGQMDTSCVKHHHSSEFLLDKDTTSRTMELTDRSDSDWYAGSGGGGGAVPDHVRRKQLFDRTSSFGTMEGSLDIHELEDLDDEDMIVASF